MDTKFKLFLFYRKSLGYEIGEILRPYIKSVDALTDDEIESALEREGFIPEKPTEEDMKKYNFFQRWEKETREEMKEEALIYEM